MATEAKIDGNQINDSNPLAVELQGGTNTIGKLAANSGVDVTSLPASIQGPGNPVVDSYTSVSVALSADTANQELVAAPGANKQIWIYGFVLVGGTAAGTVTLQDEDDTAVTGAMDITTQTVITVGPSGNFAQPIAKLATNKALEGDTVTASANGVISYAVVDVS